MGTHQHIPKGETGFIPYQDIPQEPSESEYSKSFDGTRKVIYGMRENLIRAIRSNFAGASKEDVEDILQETFAKAAKDKALLSFRGDADLKTWVTRIAVNETLNYQRSRNRHVKELSLEDEYDQTNLKIGNVPDARIVNIEDRLIKEQRHELVKQAIRELRPEFREAAILRFIDELSYEDIAQRLGIDLGTVKSRISRAKKTLQERLKAA